MTTAVSEKDFVQGERSGTFGKPGSGDSAESRLNMTMARKLLWKELHEYRLKACEEFFAIYITASIDLTFCNQHIFVWVKTSFK